MNDTSPEMRKKHCKIILSKTPEERFAMAVQMVEDIRKNYAKQHPSEKSRNIRYRIKN